MYRFESRYKNLSFYYKNKLKKFSGGVYITKDKKEAEILKKSSSVNFIEEIVEVNDNE